jgi:hypothetical protein
VLQQHLTTLLSNAVQAQDGAGLPRFVDKDQWKKLELVARTAKRYWG